MRALALLLALAFVPAARAQTPEPAATQSRFPSSEGGLSRPGTYALAASFDADAIAVMALAAFGPIEHRRPTYAAGRAGFVLATPILHARKTTARRAGWSLALRAFVPAWTGMLASGASLFRPVSYDRAFPLGELVGAIVASVLDLTLLHGSRAPVPRATRLALSIGLAVLTAAAITTFATALPRSHT